ncbi:MAG: nuclear transport factor 2 family protein [Methylophaga sp.]|nr:nuclear transport factor 2 family protein [Methylophaga sp.]
MTIPVLNACSGSANKSSYYQAYQQALQDTEASAVSDSTVKAFGKIFANLQNDDLADIINEVYADHLYFNDTFRTLRDKQALIRYLTKTGETVDSLGVTIMDIARSDNEVYIRWSMNMQFTVLGKAIKSDSVGVTHLRFNDAGEIILHQDFWDSADAFYQHIPIIGMWVRQIRGQL